MATITVASGSLANYYGPNTVEIRIYSMGDWVGPDGIPRSAGSPFGHSILNNEYVALACTVDNALHTLGYAAATLISTKNATINPNVTMGAFIIDKTTNKIVQQFGRYFQVPASPTSTTWAALMGVF